MKLGIFFDHDRTLFSRALGIMGFRREIMAEASFRLVNCSDLPRIIHMKPY